MRRVREAGLRQMAQSVVCDDDAIALVAIIGYLEIKFLECRGRSGTTV